MVMVYPSLGTVGDIMDATWGSNCAEVFLSSEAVMPCSGTNEDHLELDQVFWMMKDI
jgi:hypothetical protein